MNKTTFGKEYLEELESEAASTRKCLERIPPNLFGWKPHEKSMALGYLVVLVAEIPRWITLMIQEGVIDLSTFGHLKPKSTDELVKHFDDNLGGATRALNHVTDEALSEPFSLNSEGKVLFSSPKKENVRQAINHLVHHRGQLTIYMRLKDISVPSIYGPSADEKIF